MANDGMIDLGKKPETLGKPVEVSKEPKVYYPTLHISNVDGLDELPDGEFTFSGKGKVVSCTESTRDGKKTCSCEIEVHGIKPDGKKQKKSKEADERLDDSFDSIAKKKKDDYEDTMDDGADEDTE